MRILAITNLLPRPDEPERGVFNAQLFEAMEEVAGVQIVCLVPCWKPWQFSLIRKWRSPGPGADARGGVGTIYMPVFYLPGVGRGLSWHTYGWTMRELEPLARECAVVYSTWLYPDGVAATRLAAACGVPSWIMVQGSDTFHLDHPFRRSVIRKACETAAGIICVCRTLADRLAGIGVRPERLHVIGNGVNGGLFHFRTRDEAIRSLRERGVPEANGG